MDRGVVFGGIVVRGEESEMANVFLSYFVDFFFFEVFCGTRLPCSGDAFLKSFSFALLDGKAFPCLPAKAAGFFAVCFGLTGVFVGGFFSANLSGVAGCFFFVDGAWLDDFGDFGVAPHLVFFAAGLLVVSTGGSDWATICLSWLKCCWSCRCDNQPVS